MGKRVVKILMDLHSSMESQLMVKRHTGNVVILLQTKNKPNIVVDKKIQFVEKYLRDVTVTITDVI